MITYRKTYLRNGVVVEVDAVGHTCVTFADGRQVHGAPEGTEAQAATALALGYGDNVEGMVSDHDPLHALLCDWLGVHSFALDPIAASREPAIARAEEAAVLAVQKFMRLAGGRMPWLPTAR